MTADSGVHMMTALGFFYWRIFLTVNVYLLANRVMLSRAWTKLKEQRMILRMRLKFWMIYLIFQLQLSTIDQNPGSDSDEQMRNVVKLPIHATSFSVFTCHRLYSLACQDGSWQSQQIVGEQYTLLASSQTLLCHFVISRISIKHACRTNVSRRGKKAGPETTPIKLPSQAVPHSL